MAASGFLVKVDDRPVGRHSETFFVLDRNFGRIDPQIKGKALAEEAPMLGPQAPDRHWGIRALEFVDAVEAARTPTQVQALFKNMISVCGFHAYIMAGLPPPDESFRAVVLATGWDPEWFAMYLRDKFIDVDPVPRYAGRMVQPFEWKEAPYDPEAEPGAQMVMARALDFRMFEGFCVPIHYGDGSAAAVSMAGERVDLTAGAKAAMHLIALYAHNRARELLRKPNLPRRRILTDREREVLRWTAIGLTSWQIGEKLGITERTANAHVLSAARKLKALNRTAAVVAALRCGEIAL